jgi:hypothetical protein
MLLAVTAPGLRRTARRISAVTFSNLVHLAVYFCASSRFYILRLHHMTAIPDVTTAFLTAPDALPVPAGAPRWVTPELLADTLRVWQPYYGNLTSHDALSIITNVGNLFDVLRSSKP